MRSPPNDLNAAARNQLKTLSKENAEAVARHLAMAAEVIDADPELAHRHAIAATRRAGRIGVVRETAAITAYAIGDYALALRELRTYRRISGSDDQIALMVDSERGVGRPDRALEVGRAVDRSTLAQSVRVELAIAMSGARLDLGETERALQELDIPELDPDRAFEWSPSLFAARATVLEELGRDDEAEEWHRRAEVAEDALERGERLRRRPRGRARRGECVEQFVAPSDADEEAAALRGSGLMALFGRRSAEPTPLDGVDVVLADLDGVVYAGAGALPHAVDSLNRSREGRRLGYITNNASRTDASVAGHLSELGLDTAPADVVTSPQAAMRLLVERVAPGSTVLVVGGEGLVDELEKAGLRRHAQRRRLAGRGRAGVRPRGRLGAAGRGRVRARRCPRKRAASRGSPPTRTGPSRRPGGSRRETARWSRPCTPRSVGWRPSRASPRCRSSMRPSRGSGRSIRCSWAIGSTPTSSAPTAPASPPPSC